MTSSLRIFQSFHKPYPRADHCDWIEPIRVGRFAGKHKEAAIEEAAVDEPWLDWLSDATGHSITALNAHYCELTAQYWVWKNLRPEPGAPQALQRPDIVGFYHYRRYLNFMFDNTWQGEFAFAVPIEGSMLPYLSSEAQRERLLQLMRLSDVIIPARFVSEQTVEAKYFHHHPAHTWLAFERAIKRLQPALAAYLPLFSLSNRQTVYNMFVMPWAIFDRYCADLFLVIDDCFTQCDTGYGSYNDRYPGFLAERFLGLWLYAHGLRVLEVPMLMLTEGEDAL